MRPPSRRSSPPPRPRSDASGTEAGPALIEPLAFTNPKVQRLRRLLGRRSARHDEGAFVVEGPLLLAEAERAGWDIELELSAPGAPAVTRAPRLELAPGVLERVATTQTPQPTLGVVRMPTSGPDLGSAGFVVVADAVADPGNLGTILRSAEAAGADAVALGPGSVDPYNPKTVRASAGALFHVPVIQVVALADLRAAGLRVVGTSSHRGVAHTELDWTGRVAVVVGNEAHGLPDDAAVDEWVTIRHRGRAESLNVAMATAVVCFEIARQRERGAPVRNPG